MQVYAEHWFAAVGAALLGLLCLLLVVIAGAPNGWIPIVAVALTVSGALATAVLAAVRWRQRRRN